MVTICRRALLFAPLAQYLSAKTELRFIALGQALMTNSLREPPYPGFDELRRSLAWGDVVFSNLESPVRGGEEKADPNVLTHSVPAQALDSLRALGINLLSLANNHSFDLGARGLERTIAESKSRGFAVAGTGRNELEAAAPGYLRLPSTRAALVAFASRMNLPAGAAGLSTPGANHLAMASPGQLNAADSARILHAISDASKLSNFVVAYHHDHYWEADNSQTAEWKIAWAHRCIEAGANVFISHGAPLLHGIEIYRDRPIFYDLGNFVFQTRKPVGEYPASAWQGAIAKCEFRDSKITSLVLQPISLNERGETGDRFFETRGRPSMAHGDQAKTILEGLRAASKRFGGRISIENETGRVEL